MGNMADLDQLLTPEEVAKLFGVSVQTLAHWRSTRQVDLPFLRMGGRLIRYRRLHIEQFLAKRVHQLPPQAAL